MWLTAALGLFQMYFPLGMFDPPERRKKPANFVQNMLIVGGLR